VFFELFPPPLLLRAQLSVVSGQLKCTSASSCLYPVVCLLLKLGFSCRCGVYTFGLSRKEKTGIWLAFLFQTLSSFLIGFQRSSSLAAAQLHHLKSTGGKETQRMNESSLSAAGTPFKRNRQPNGGYGWDPAVYSPETWRRTVIENVSSLLLSVAYAMIQCGSSWRDYQWCNIHRSFLLEFQQMQPHAQHKFSMFKGSR